MAKKKNMKMTSYKNRRESKRKVAMRIITLSIAIIVIVGLVIIIPLNVSAAYETEPTVAEQIRATVGIGDIALVVSGFAAGFLLGEFFRWFHKKRQIKDGEKL
jgi:uncharacterized membrane protein YbjE (DUF340 family)